jgi:hypothetical protein
MECYLLFLKSNRQRMSKNKRCVSDFYISHTFDWSESTDNRMKICAVAFSFSSINIHWPLVFLRLLLSVNQIYCSSYKHSWINIIHILSSTILSMLTYCCSYKQNELPTAIGRFIHQWIKDSFLTFIITRINMHTCHVW